MAELVSVFLGCLAAYTLASFIRTRSEQNLWVAGFTILSVYVCLLALGPGYTLLLIGLGIACVSGLRYREGQRDYRPLLRAAVLPSLALLIAYGLALLLGLSLPIRSTAAMPGVLLALLSGMLFASAAELRIHRRRWPPPQQFYTQLGLNAVYSLLAIYLALSVYSLDPGLFIIVMALLAVLMVLLQQAQQARGSLQRETQEITLVRNLGQFMPSDLDELLNTIYQYVSQGLDAMVFYIAIHDEERETLDFRLVRVEGAAAQWNSRPLSGDSAAEKVLQKKLVLRINQADEVPELPPDMIASPELDYLGVPLLVSGRVVGVMAIVSAEAHSLDNNDVQVLQTVANQIGLAVRNATLYARQAEQVEKLSKINNSVHQIMFNRNRDSALEAAVAQAAAIANSETAAIFLRQDDRLCLETAYGMADVHRQWLLAHPPAIRDEREYINNTAEVGQQARAEESIIGGFRALAEIPLRADQTTHGMLAVYYPAPHYFRQRELDLLETLANQITAMLENVRLFSVMDGYAAEMSQLIQLSRISTSSLQLDGVLHDIAETLQQMAAVNRVSIYLFEKDAQQVRLLANVNGAPDSADSEGSYIGIFPELSALTPEAASRAYNHTDARLSEAMRQQMQHYGEQSIALVPLVLENVVLGAVLLGSREMRQFAEREWQFIELATTQISAQINNIKLHDRILQDLNRRLAQIAVIEDVAQQVSSSLNFNTVIQHVLAAAMNAIDAELVSLGLMAENEQFWVMERRVEQGRALYRYMSQRSDKGLMGQVFKQRKSLILPDHSAADYYVSDYEGIYHSSIAVPLIKDEAVIGVLNGESTRPNAFRTEHAAFLSRLAGHAVMSIENARFLEARQREIDMLQRLRELAVWLISVDNTREVAHQVLETAVQLLEGQGAVLYLAGRDGGALKMITMLGVGDMPAPDGASALPQELALEAVKSGEVRMMSDLSAHPAYDAALSAGYTSLLAIPLKRSQQVQHVLLITFAHRRYLQAHDHNTIALLAAQAVGHLENAALHERIRSGRDQMRAILDSTQDGMILLDRDANLVETNPAAQRLLGIQLDDYIGQSFPEILQEQRMVGNAASYSADAIDNLMKTLRQNPEAATQLNLERVADGQAIYIEEVGLPVRDAEQAITGRLLVLRDVTRGRLLEAQREDFTDMVVHDLRGPLGSIRNALDLALDHVGEPESQQENRMLLQASRQNANRLMGLVETLLDIAKMQSPDMVLDREPVAVQALVETAQSALLSSMQQAGLHFIQEIPPDLPDVYVDRDKILRVLINLLDNAVRYTSAKGEVMVSAQVLEVGKWLEMRISDSGDGIPPDLRDGIFERFRRVPGQRPLRGHQGHGLGLSFTRQAVEKHGGSIRIADDCSSSGACFVFTLPIFKDNES